MNARVPGLLAALVLAATSAAAQNGYPEWNGRPVQDLAGVLSPGLEDSVRTLLAPARNQGIDVRVVTVARTRPQPASSSSDWSSSSSSSYSSSSSSSGGGHSSGGGASGSW